MGYKVRRTTFDLQFTDPNLEGLEVTARSVPVGEFRRIGEISLLAPELQDEFAKLIVSWNLEEDDGQPVPVTAESIRTRLEPPYWKAIVAAWFESVAGVTGPLASGSGSGPDLETELALLSKNLPS